MNTMFDNFHCIKIHCFDRIRFTPGLQVEQEAIPGFCRSARNRILHELPQVLPAEFADWLIVTKFFSEFTSNELVSISPEDIVDILRRSDFREESDIAFFLQED